ncbi:MAG TPA: hypothetical protein VNP73_06610 [Actinomycetota bacterium]|nr:hypothetical protein [Actinomycetota bacterium]
MKTWLIATGAIYALGAVDFIARPWAATASLGNVGGDEMETESVGLYNALASSYMATIAALSFSAARDPLDKRDLIPPLLVAKAVSSATMMYRYFTTKKRGYAYGAALDAFLLGTTAGLAASLEEG